MEEGAVLDQIFISLRWNGFYQKSRAILFFMSLINFAIQNVSFVFIGKSVPFRCHRPQSLNVTIGNVHFNLMAKTHDVNVSYRDCHIDVSNGSNVIFTTACPDGYEYEDMAQSSYVSDWNLVCEKESYSDISQSVFVGGQMFGCLVLTRFADMHGRKISFLLTSLMCLLTAVVCSFSPTYMFYLVFRFLAGASIASSGQLAKIQIVELMPTSHRALPDKLYSFLWTTSILLLCLIAYLTRTLSWQYTQLILSVFSAYSLFLWWVSDESLRWLCAVKRNGDAEKLIKKIARINQVDPETALHILRNNDISSEHQEIILLENGNKNIVESKKVASNKDTELSTLIKNRALLKVTFIASYLWFVDTLAYEGLLMISPGLHDDFYVGFILGVIVEFPASLIFCLLINRIGRKKCTSIFHLLAGISLMISTLVLNTPLADYLPGTYWSSLFLSLLGRLALSTGYCAVLIFATELFPTSVRNICCGIAGFGAYLAATLAPYTRTLSRHVPWLPSLVFGAMCMTVPLVIITLPETMGQELAQTLDDMASRRKKQKPRESDSNVK